MKNKGFTLIELLAVIVILAIIAFIATPIILNIINDSKISANERSKELYISAVEQSIAREQMKNIDFKPTSCIVNGTGNLNCKAGEEDLPELPIDTKGTIPKVGGKITLENGKVISNDLVFDNGTKEETNQICTLVSGTSQQVGSKYTCQLDEARTFYVLENNASSNEITLIMDRNYTDEEVPATMTWCSGYKTNNACNHDKLDPYIAKIQTKFGGSVIVGIPSKEQIEGAYTGSMPQWLYDYLVGTTNPVSNVYGYWTSTGDSSSSNFAWSVSYNGSVSSCVVGGRNHVGGGLAPADINGIRPVIIVSKSDLS